MEKITARELAECLFDQDVEFHDRWELDPEDGNPMTEDGNDAYDAWLLSSANAGDSDTREDLLSVDRDEFARSWDNLVEEWKESKEDEEDEE